mmetsp:Transcript_41015/g.97451  ORF Transcript_41015/g.97451 Transcript_41015/m.97451 type:complete len:224 (-) Transcript_41015:261-932(-)
MGVEVQEAHHGVVGDGEPSLPRKRPAEGAVDCVHAPLAWLCAAERVLERASLRCRNDGRLLPLCAAQRDGAGDRRVRGALQELAEPHELPLDVGLEGIYMDLVALEDAQLRLADGGSAPQHELPPLPARPRDVLHAAPAQLAAPPGPQPATRAQRPARGEPRQRPRACAAPRRGLLSLPALRRFRFCRPGGRGRQLDLAILGVSDRAEGLFGRLLPRALRGEA